MIHRPAASSLPLYCLTRSLTKRASSLALLFVLCLATALLLSGQPSTALLGGLSALLLGVLEVTLSSWRRHRYLWEHCC